MQTERNKEYYISFSTSNQFYLFQLILYYDQLYFSFFFRTFWEPNTTSSSEQGMKFVTWWMHYILLVLWTAPKVNLLALTVTNSVNSNYRVPFKHLPRWTMKVTGMSSPFLQLLDMANTVENLLSPWSVTDTWKLKDLKAFRSDMISYRVKCYMPICCVFAWLVG